ncbi:MAG: GspE/PulE family protein [bacterium]|nr:GspE/PulE family protein [bacterium]
MRDSATLKLAIEKTLVQPLEKISVVELVDLLVEYAYVARASDIHIHPEEDTVRIRMRVDGLLHDLFEKINLRKEVHQEIISRIKVLSGLRTDEHLMPQDGRFKVKIKDFGAVDVRVSIMPTYAGENAILRVLASTQNFTLDDLGFAIEDLKKVGKAVEKPYGMILANGPTGSGKTTTLYTILKRLNRPEASIITIEDPIEYSLVGTTQVQISEHTGLTFASGLRSILRQDPNIIMVGEIRDQETAGIAVNAALTGHLVLSTLHTNDAATTFPRLLDMGVPPFLVASTMNIAIGQRLVRKLCDKCTVKRVLSASEVKSVAEILPDIKGVARTFYEGKGCGACGKTGYQGRIGVREVIEVNEEIRTLVMNRANAGQIKEAAIRGGMTTMLKDGLEKAANGLTSIEEVLRIIHE